MKSVAFYSIHTSYNNTKQLKFISFNFSLVVLFSFSIDYLKPFCEIKDLYKCKLHYTNSLYLTGNAEKSISLSLVIDAFNFLSLPHYIE